MTDKIQLEEGNRLIYVVEYTPLYRSIHFWVIEAKEMPKSWRVVKAHEYCGNGLVKQVSYNSYISKSYNKSDKRVYLDFELAREYAVKTLSSMIERIENGLMEQREKLKTWNS